MDGISRYRRRAAEGNPARFYAGRRTAADRDRIDGAVWRQPPDRARGAADHYRAGPDRAAGGAPLGGDRGRAAGVGYAQRPNAEPMAAKFPRNPSPRWALH